MSLTRALGHAVLVLSCLSLAGCGFIFESRAERATRNSPNFRSGYSDGCATANAQGTNFGRAMTRDDALYRSDRAYRAGWAAGVSACQSTLARQPGTPSTPIPDVNPGR
jgi:hypothetical protein